MIKAVALIIFVSLCSCNQSTLQKSGYFEDTLSANPSGSKEDDAYNNYLKEAGLPQIPKVNTDNMISRKADSIFLMKMSAEILRSIKTRNYKKLASFIHPEYGIRFSPYAYINTTDDRKFSADELQLLAKQGKAINWNSSWGSERGPEFLTIDQYFKRYVYDVDFLNAELASLNKFHSQGTDLNNIEETYVNCDVVEFFFSGFEEKYGGMDYRALRLVFKMQDKRPYLIGVVHDEWTP